MLTLFCMIFITGNVHIDYRRHQSTSWVLDTAAGYASSKFLPRERYASGRSGRAGLYVYWRGCYTRSDSFTDFHSLKKIKYKSSFIGNDYQTVGYLGKEAYNTTAYSLIQVFSVHLRVESLSSA